MRGFICKAFVSKVIRNLYATPLPLFVSSAPPLHWLYSIPSVPLCALWCKNFRSSAQISEEPTSFPLSLYLIRHHIIRWIILYHTVFIVKKILTLHFRRGVNSARINALLASKRCPLRPLLTPFWTLNKHLLLSYFITSWFPVSCKPAHNTCFLPLFQGFYWRKRQGFWHW